MRKMEEDRAREVLARVLVKVNEQETRRRRARRLYQTETDLFEKTQREAFDIDLFRMYDRYLERLLSEVDEAGDRIEELRPDLEQAREFVVERSRNRRVVEILKERKRAEYDQEVRKKERKELEEYNRLQQRKPLVEEPTEKEKLDEDWKSRSPEDDYDIGEEPEQAAGEVDPIAEYFKQLGIPDPRKEGGGRS